MKNRSIKLIALLCSSFLMMSWGYNGHYKINQGAALSFNPEMEQFMAWAVTLAQHASDADERKDEDPDEGPRHYIDIDNYPGFAENGRIPQAYDSVVALYGEDFVIDQGVLPWATHIAYDSLVNCFIRFDWEKAVLFASDLGHYVADAHQPLHITRNYDGQYTNNGGIHSRYESGMINAFIGEIAISEDAISLISDVNGYIFNYIYLNYIYVDSIMAADDYAQAAAGNTYTYEYKQALWERCGNFTNKLFNNSSNILASLIYTAWVEAGKPDMNSGPGIFEYASGRNKLRLEVSPNPFQGIVKIKFILPESSDICFRIIDIQGNVIDAILNENLPEGPNEFLFNLSNLPEGIYTVSLETGLYQESIKILKINH